ncbi:MAG: hypothetical protein NTV24_03480 [Candidatus Woesebacteria bacterium]|nr:hypothetical protein [Candidatus Woesebacteria bacterium]
MSESGNWIDRLRERFGGRRSEEREIERHIIGVPTQEPTNLQTPNLPDPDWAIITPPFDVDANIRTDALSSSGTFMPTWNDNNLRGSVFSTTEGASILFPFTQEEEEDEFQKKVVGSQKCRYWVILKLMNGQRDFICGREGLPAKRRCSQPFKCEGEETVCSYFEPSVKNVVEEKQGSIFERLETDAVLKTFIDKRV